MNLSLERPEALYGLLLIIPALLFVSVRYIRIMRGLARQAALRTDVADLWHIRRSFIMRTLFRTAAWVMLVLAYAGLSWGTTAVPVQKNGSAVCMVIDISYSMEAPDGPDGMTRLQAATAYIDALLDHLPASSAAIVLAKGDGVAAVPLTEDVEALRTLLPVLSPAMMTAQGSSLGGGIQAAIRAFPPQSAQAANIWLFTDGEETDGALEEALTDAMKYGVPVAIVGFGSEQEQTILSGDGETPVQTALRSAAIRDTIESVRKKARNRHDRFAAPGLFYVPATEPGSARRLLNSLKPVLTLPGAEEGSSVMYEERVVERHALFTALAVVCVIASFVFGELRGTRRVRREPVVAAALLALLCTGCTGRFGDGVALLEGRLAWNRQDYQEAVADFLDVELSARRRGDAEVEQYALLALAATYLMQDENESAGERFARISPDAPPAIRFAMLYDSGIIAYRAGNFPQAAALFREALLVNSADINAKINLELSLREEASRSRAMEQMMTPVAEDGGQQSSLESALYSIIREKEQQQWKNQQQESHGSGPDY